MCYFIALKKLIFSNKNLSEADLWHTEHENSMWNVPRISYSFKEGFILLHYSIQKLNSTAAVT